MSRAGVILLSGLVAAGSIVGARWALAHREDVPRMGERPFPSTSRESFSGPAPLALGQQVPDAALIVQDGRTVRLSDLRGRPLVLSFIYTRCNVASMCPGTIRHLMDLQALARSRDLNVNFLVVSFDPADRPPILAEFARRMEVDLGNWNFATGPAGTITPLARAMNTYFRMSAGEMFEHNIVVAVVDARGILRDEFFGAEWNPEDILKALRRAGS